MCEKEVQLGLYGGLENVAQRYRTKVKTSGRFVNKMTL